MYQGVKEEAIAFYEALGFVALRDAKPLPMFLHIEKIVEAIGDVEINR